MLPRIRLRGVKLAMISPSIDGDDFTRGGAAGEASVAVSVEGVPSVS